MITIRDAALADAGQLLEIYGYYTERTAISFECETPSLTEFRSRMERIMRRYPYLVAEQDGCVIGYAYAAPFVGRAAYDWGCETTIYLAPDARKCGAGRILYEALENALKRMGILCMYACIGLPEQPDEYLTANSAEFHAHMGFTEVGRFRRCGRKFGRWYHMIWMEKLIGEHRGDQPPVLSYRETKEGNA